MNGQDIPILLYLLDRLVWFSLLATAGGIVIRGIAWLWKVFRQWRTLGDAFIVTATIDKTIHDRLAEVQDSLPIRLTLRHEPVVWIWMFGLLFSCFGFLSYVIGAIRRERADVFTSTHFVEIGFGIAVTVVLWFCLIYLMRKFRYEIRTDGVMFRTGLLGTRLLPWSEIHEAAILGSPAIGAEVVHSVENGEKKRYALFNVFRDPRKFEIIRFLLLGARSTASSDEQ